MEADEPIRLGAFKRAISSAGGAQQGRLGSPGQVQAPPQKWSHPWGVWGHHAAPRDNVRVQQGPDLGTASRHLVSPTVCPHEHAGHVISGLQMGQRAGLVRCSSGACISGMAGWTPGTSAGLFSAQTYAPPDHVGSLSSSGFAENRSKNYNHLTFTKKSALLHQKRPVSNTPVCAR